MSVSQPNPTSCRVQGDTRVLHEVHTFPDRWRTLKDFLARLRTGRLCRTSGVSSSLPRTTMNTSAWSPSMKSACGRQARCCSMASPATQAGPRVRMTANGRDMLLLSLSAEEESRWGQGRPVRSAAPLGSSWREAKAHGRCVCPVGRPIRPCPHTGHDGPVTLGQNCV
jgi:hypothetical protein